MQALRFDRVTTGPTAGPTADRADADPDRATERRRAVPLTSVVEPAAARPTSSSTSPA